MSNQQISDLPDFGIPEDADKVEIERPGSPGGSGHLTLDEFVKRQVAAQLAAAYTTAVDDDGTQSSGTYTPSFASGSNTKKIVNGGAFAIGQPSPASGEAVVLDLLIINNASAGAITTSALDLVTGDAFDTVNGSVFDCTLKVYNIGGTIYSHLHVDQVA